MTCLPWMKNINNAPWLTQQTLFDRTISLFRLRTLAGDTDAIGAVGYSGAETSALSPTGEIPTLTNIPASIQLAAAGKTTKNVDLPGDATTKAVWNIVIPASAAPLYSIRDRDLIYDDEGYRYEVGANYWDNGYVLSAIRLEA